MKKVYTYLDIPFYEHNFQKVVQITREDDETFGIPGLHDIRPVVAPQKVDFLQILGPDVVRHVHTKCAWYFKLYGYPLPTPRKVEEKAAAPAR